MNLSPDVQKKLLMVFSVILVLQLLFLMRPGKAAPKNSVYTKASSAIADALGAEVGRIEKKDETVLLSVDFQTCPDFLLKEREGTVASVLKKQGGVSSLEIERVDGNDIPHGPSAGLSGDVFLRIIQKHPRASLIVSLVGPPVWKEGQLAQAGAHPPRIIALSLSGNAESFPALVDGLIVPGALGNVTVATPSAKAPASPSEN